MGENKSMEEKNLKAIERLSDELENIYKELEMIHKENLLFESYLQRTQNDDISMSLEAQNLSESMQYCHLSLEEKHKIAIEEENHLKSLIQKDKVEAEEAMDRKRAEMENIDIAIKQIKKEAAEFQAQVLENPIHTTNGQIDAHKIIKFREFQLAEKQKQILQMEGKKKALEIKLLKVQGSLRKKRDKGDQLKFIDFHQLQIENKKFLKELTEKNESLLELKLQTGSIIENLNESKKRLADQLQLKEQYKKDISTKKVQLEVVKKEKKDLTNMITEVQNKNEKLTLQKSKMDDNKNLKMKINNFIKDKETENALKYEIKNLKRKIEILRGNPASKELTEDLKENFSVDN